VCVSDSRRLALSCSRLGKVTSVDSKVSTLIQPLDALGPQCCPARLTGVVAQGVERDLVRLWPLVLGDARGEKFVKRPQIDSRAFFRFNDCMNTRTEFVARKADHN